MYRDISDLPTTLRETLSEAKLELYLRAYRRAYDSLAEEGVDADAREASAHEEAMRAVEYEREEKEARYHVEV
jgi:cation transport regulator ChaB